MCLRVDGDTGQRTQNGAGERIEHGDLLDRVVEQLDAQRLLVGFRGEHIDDVATHPVGTAMEVDVVAGVLQLGQPPEEMALIEQVAAIQMQHHLQVRAGISEAIDRRNRRHHDDIAALEVMGHAPLNLGASRTRVTELQRVPVGPSQVKRFGHAAIKTADLVGVSQWYADTLGLLVSDNLQLGEPDALVGRFMRCDRGDLPADHHTLLILGTGEAKLGHCAWEVADFDDLMAGHDHLLAADHRHYWGVGRHVLGGQVFDYWKDPLGFTVEHWTDSDLLTASAPPGTYDLFDPINQWGPNPPEDLDF